MGKRGRLRAETLALAFTAVLCFLSGVSCEDNKDMDNSLNFFYTSNDPMLYRHDGEYMNQLNSEWGTLSGRVPSRKCVDIPDNLTLCADIGYKQMKLPNLLEHDSLHEVTAQATSWVPLVRINCHPDAKVFLCSLFSPVCFERFIYPCRSMCQNVHDACVASMNRYGFEWPEMLQCDKFPVDNDMCIKLHHDITPDNNCTACKHPMTHESLIDNFCRTDIVLRATIKSFRNVNGHREIILRNKKKIYKSKDVRKSEVRKLVPIIEHGASCVCDTINATQVKYLLMGTKRDGKLVIHFGMVWNKKDKEFKKGLRAIRKSSTCEGIFRELTNNGSEKRNPGNSRPKTGTEKKGKKGGKRGKGRKGGKRGKNGKKGGKKGKKRKGKKGKKGKKKGKKGKKNGSKNKNKDNKNNKKQPMTKSEIEDQALDNFQKASN